MIIKKAYSFALKSAMVITVLSLLIGFLVISYIDNYTLQILIISILIFVFTFFVIQYRVERFIYQRVKKIYQTVSILDMKKLKQTPITSDMASLTDNVEKFAQEKLLEIETLNKQSLYRKEFMGNIAHELKTPLFSVQSYLLTLLDDDAIDKKIRKKYLNRSAKNIERLVNIVEDLDLITKMDTHAIELDIQEIDIVSLIIEVFELLEINAAKNQIRLSFDKSYFPVKVFADKNRIEQVLTNLLTNAIRYGRKKSVCKVKINKNEKTGKVFVHVIDQGEGIPAQHLSRLFERFYRVDKGRSREEGGTGLGLAIVKHIVEIHDGEVGVYSELGVGSDFWFSLDAV
jgi:two-component system phosphate regulon sensor histidine kinase PhoR